MDKTNIIIFLLLLIVSLYSYDLYQQTYINLEYEYYIFMNNSDKHRHLEIAKKYQYGSDKIKINYHKALDFYHMAIQNKNYVAYIYLAQLYLEIRDIESAIYYYNKSIEKGYFQCFINLGDIYLYEKDYIDYDLAEQNYKAAIKYSTFIDAKIKANDKLKVLKIEKKDNINIIQDIDTLMKYDTNDNIKNIHQNDYQNDYQNVHDHIVSNTVKKSIDNLIEKTKILTDKSQSLINIRNFISQQKNKELALMVIDHIETSMIKYRDTKLLESDLLHLVWNRIHNECNKKNMNELKNNLYNRLIECNEDNTYVCDSGIFSRIIDTLNYCDAENIVEIIPKYVLNKELMTKASIISEKFKKEQSIDIQLLLDKLDLNQEEEKKVKDYIERLKIKLVSDFKKDYIETNIISENILFLEINKWIDYI